MRNRRKMETVRIRKANATTEKEKVMYFAQDRDVSTRILAILSVGQTKSGVKKEVIGADGKTTAIFMPEITRYKVICGSNGKVGTRFNTVIIPKEQKGRVIVKETIDNGSVGRKLTDKEFVELYPKQCNIFKEIFKEEYKALTKKIKV